MKNFILYLLLAFANMATAQLTEVYNFGYSTGPSSYDFSGESRERLYQGKFFYYVQDNTTKKTFLYYKDTSANPPVAVKDITATSPQTTVMTTIMTYKSNEKYLYFTTYTYISSSVGINELWRTDGTEAGTVKLGTFQGASPEFFNIKSWENSVKSNVQAKNSINGDFIFTSSPTPNTRAVWITNGTPEGTVKLMENSVNNSSTAAYAAIDKIGNRMLFTVFGSGNYWEVWSTDGTAADTQFLSTLHSSMGVLNGKYYFYSNINNAGNTISYTADGLTMASKALSIAVQGIDGYINGGTEIYLGAPLGNALYHSTDFSDIKKIADLPQTNTYFLAASEAGLLFAKLLNYNISNQYTFYVAGRDTGVTTVNTGSFFKSSTDTFAYKNTFYMANELKTDAQNYGRELWRIDNVHTELLKDIYPGYTVYSGITFMNNSSPKGFFTHNDEMYFIAELAGGVRLMKFNADFTFNNSTQDNKWSSAANWNAGATPMLTDNASIPATNNLTIDGTAYAGNLQVQSPVTVTDGVLNISGTANLNSKITLDNSKLILKGLSSQITGGSASSYVATNGNSTTVIENLGNNRGTVNLPMGTNSNFNPVTLANSGVADSFSVKVSDGIANTTSGAVNTTWEITEGTAGGSNATLSLGWNQQQENGSFQRSTAKVGHFVNGIWTEENSGNVTGANPFIITASGISSFSPFAVMNFGTMGSVDLNQTQIAVFPNPFVDILNVKSAESGILQLFDMSGKLISSEPLLKGLNSLQKSNLRKGMYLYKVQSSDNRTIKSGKVMKN